MSDFFKFEDSAVDFPFYNNNPKLSESEWCTLILGLGLFIFLLIGPVIVPQSVFSISLFFALAIPTVYALKRNVILLFKKPKLSDLKLIILCFAGYYIYTVIVLVLFEVIGFQANPHAMIDTVTVNAMFIISVFSQLMGEELYKILIFLIVMYASYSVFKNRKFSMIISTFITLMAFGLAHYGAYGNLIQIILIQGFGSIFELYSYLKTKNIIVSYALHLLIDAIPFIFMAIS